jgi:hypothetical protein
MENQPMKPGQNAGNRPPRWVYWFGGVLFAVVAVVAAIHLAGGGFAPHMP